MINIDNLPTVQGRKVIPTTELCKLLGVQIRVDKLIELGFQPIQELGIAKYWDFEDVILIARAVSESVIASACENVGLETRLHTPSPWFIECIQHNQVYAQIRAGGSGNSPLICVQPFPSKYQAEGEVQANGRLIAAAPDLFDSLKKARSVIVDSGLGDQLPKVVQGIDKVLQKAGAS